MTVTAQYTRDTPHANQAPRSSAQPEDQPAFAVATPRRRGAFGPWWRAGLLAAAVAAVGNLVVYALARTLGVTLLMPLQPGAEPVLLPVGMVIFASVVGASAASAVFALLTRFAPRSRPLFVIVGLAFLLLSLSAPLTLAATDGATKATLVLMHLLAGGSITSLLAARGRGLNAQS